eukprot:11131216-Karenia_brevis.AAC.1
MPCCAVLCYARMAGCYAILCYDGWRLMMLRYAVLRYADYDADDNDDNNTDNDDDGVDDDQDDG